MRKFVVCLSLFTFIALPGTALASKMKPVEPAGAERQKQYVNVLEKCRKRFGGGSSMLTAEWGVHYGQWGWWCAYRR